VKCNLQHQWHKQGQFLKIKNDISNYSWPSNHAANQQINLTKLLFALRLLPRLLLDVKL